jgi:phage terminase large subunit-like protein
MRLQDEDAIVEFRQGIRSAAAPTREQLIVSKKLVYGGNPVTRWIAANVAVAQNPPATSGRPRTSRPSASTASSPC